MGSQRRKLQQSVSRQNACRQWVRRWGEEDTTEQLAVTLGTALESMMEAGCPAPRVVEATAAALVAVAAENGAELSDIIAAVGRQWAVQKEKSLESATQDSSEG